MSIPRVPKSLEHRYRMRMEKKKRRNVVSNTPKADGLRMIGRHAYAAKQEMESKAETLYKGKVLIDR